jgi:hypothetical protein
VCLSALPAAALAELALELELSVSGAVAPARTRDRMDFEPKSELVALLSGVRATPPKRDKGAFRGASGHAPGRHRVSSKSRGLQIKSGEILGLEASSILDDLLSQRLIYCNPSRESNFWQPTIGFAGSGFCGLTPTFRRSKSSSVVRHAERNAG